MTNDYVTDINAGKIESEDCISRQEAISAIINEYYPNAIAIDIVDSIANLPSVTPKAKMGRWTDGKCNRCGTHAPFWMMASTYHCSNYCPNCGAKMQEEEE